jgi:hypothetical protein
VSRLPSVRALLAGTLLAAAALLLVPVFRRGAATVEETAAPEVDGSASESEAPDRAREPGPIPLPVFLGGRPFPRLEENAHASALPEPRRSVFVSPEAAPGGDGTRARPLSKLQASLESLGPGDRLTLLPGAYGGPFTVGETCRDGTEGSPIQVVAEDGAVLRAHGDGAVLTVARGHWSFQGIVVEPGSSTSFSGVLLAPAAHDVVFDLGRLKGGKGPGIGIAQGARRITISRCDISGFWRGGAKVSHGIQVSARVHGLTVAGNTIHGNQGCGMFVAGPRGKGKGMGSFIEKLTIVGNTFHGDGMHGVKIRGGSREVRIADNRFWDYRPFRNSRGAAILIYPNVRDTVIEGNHIADSSIGVHLGTGEPGTGITLLGPRGIGILRNYFECGGLPGSVAVSVNSGTDVRIHNNVIDRCAEGLDLRALPPAGSFSIANNLFLSPGLAFALADPAVLEIFDHNLVAAGPRSARARVRGEMREVAGYAADGRNPAAMVRGPLALSGRDLASVAGPDVVDRGRVFEEEPFLGAAPDLGVAER